MGLFNWKRGAASARTLEDKPGPVERGREAKTQPESADEAAHATRQGIAALEKGDYRSAAQSFRRVVALAPYAASNHVNLAFALQESGAGAEALSHLRQAVAIDETSFDAQYMVATALDREGDRRGAALHLRRAVELRPQFAAAQVDLCRVLVAEGDLRAARLAIEAALVSNPTCADFHHSLGNVCMAEDDPVAAVLSYRRALALEPSYVQVHANLGLALRAQNDLDAAADCFARLIERDPRTTDALVQHALTRKMQGRLDEAADSLQRALALMPDHAEALNALGGVLLEQGQIERAVDTYRAVAALRPDLAGGHLNLGLALHAQEDFGAALSSYAKALEIEPSAGGTFARIGASHRAQGNLAESAQAFQRAVDLTPDDVETVNSLGNVLRELGHLDRAAEAFRKVIALRPDAPGGYANLGAALFDQGDTEGAIAACRQGLARHPTAELHDNLAIALQRQGALDEAIEQFERALALQPDSINALSNFAAALAEAGQLARAVATTRRVLRLEPAHRAAHSSLIYNLTFLEGCSADQYLAEVRAFDAGLPRGLLEPLPPRVDGATTSRKLRIGFVSGDLYEHPVGRFIEGILHHLDQSRFALFAYLTTATEDALSTRIKPRFASWASIRGVSDLAAARAIRHDAIDILIDLSGHSGSNRLALFALRPAPLQLTWLGYFASTGVTEIDYLLADEVCLPPGTEHIATEKVWRLPQTRMCYTPPPDASTPAVAPLPALANGHVTFGCFQRFAKIGDAVLALWGRVFAEVPGAHLLMQSHQTDRLGPTTRMLQRLAGVGIGADRVTFRPPGPRQAYLETYASVDIVLDTFPYTGGTTTCEALWMGVPTLTLIGDSMLARQGAALLTAAGLPDWAAADSDQFVAKAMAFASDLERLAGLRGSLRQQVQESPLFDTRLFARRLEDALRGMWQARSEGLGG